MKNNYIRLTDNYVVYFARSGSFGKTTDIKKYLAFAEEMRKRGLLHNGN